MEGDEGDELDEGALSLLFDGVYDARRGEWRERLRYWNEPSPHGYGIESALGRPANLVGYGEQYTSVFDPVLAERLYLQWVRPLGIVLDPFAGGSVRAVVAARLEHPYFGVELSKRQIDANVLQADRIKMECGEADLPWVAPTYINADARTIRQIAPIPNQVHLVFTCPPYFNLERYSNDARDLSNAESYAQFLVGYEEAIAASLARLCANHFACFVVGDVRDAHTGAFFNLVGDTIAIFLRHGACLYNHAVLLTMAKSAAVRARAALVSSGKLTTVHQHVLVFFKGTNPRAHKHEAGLVPDRAIPTD